MKKRTMERNALYFMLAIVQYAQQSWGKRSRAVNKKRGAWRMSRVMIFRSSQNQAPRQRQM
jgi:hypothetical protein